MIISSGIDLSIGSLVCLAACLLALFLQVDYVPVGQVDVWQVRADDSTITVAAERYSVRGSTIAGGSREVQAMVTAKRVLGL